MLADAEQVRGGFDLSAGITVRFGVDMTASLAGGPAQQIVLPSGTTAPAAAASGQNLTIGFRDN
jgi:hypothetical protein